MSRPIRFTLLLSALGVVMALGAGLVQAAEPFIVVQSTTSTQNSGLFDSLLPHFQSRTGIQVRVVAVGTGQALRNARNGDADAVFVHAKADEEQFVADGWGVKRQAVMSNDFVIVGPAADPAGVGGLTDAPAALTRIATSRAVFVSRGDDSGTHKKEQHLWRLSGLDPTAASGSWYRETGAGMGATLNTTVGMAGYTLTDRGTWISFRNKADLRVLVEGDSRLRNQYSVILVNPARHPHVKAAQAQAFIDWLIGPEAQGLINAYVIDGQQLFFPNAAEPDQEETQLDSPQQPTR